MSGELFVFLCKSKLSNRDSWQTEIGKLGYGLSIDPNLKVFEDEGFVPCELNGAQTGFEIFFEDAIAVATNQPELNSKLNGRDLCIVFRWGGDLNEAASALARRAKKWKPVFRKSGAQNKNLDHRARFRICAR